MCLKYAKNGVTNINQSLLTYTQIKHALLAEMAFNKLFIMEQSIAIYKLQARFIFVYNRVFCNRL